DALQRRLDPTAQERADLRDADLRDKEKPPRGSAAVRGSAGAAWAPAVSVETAYGKTISTRRFCGSRTPSAVGTRWSFLPRPLTAIACRATPLRASALATLLARRSDSR